MMNMNVLVSATLAYFMALFVVLAFALAKPVFLVLALIVFCFLVDRLFKLERLRNGIVSYKVF